MEIFNNKEKDDILQKIGKTKPFKEICNQREWAHLDFLISEYFPLYITCVDARCSLTNDVSKNKHPYINF